jgi:hypothetical protein
MNFRFSVFAIARLFTPKAMAQTIKRKTTTQNNLLLIITSLLSLGKKNDCGISKK